MSSKPVGATLNLGEAQIQTKTNTNIRLTESLNFASLLSSPYMSHSDHCVLLYGEANL